MLIIAFYTIFVEIFDEHDVILAYVGLYPGRITKKILQQKLSRKRSGF